MSWEDESKSSPDKDLESSGESKSHSKIRYTRDFLLSLSELDGCKKLPRGFDRSLLSEFEDASYSAQDWQRIPGSLPLQSSRRTEYSSSPPTRGDSSNYSRGTYARWENRSSGRNERDIDSQSDWNSDSGKRNGNQSRQSWQSSEHDGLLGSGSFPRTSGCVAGLSAPKVRSNEQSQLNKSNEPYHPPRPYKAAPQSRREYIDSCNDETFGVTECADLDRAEEDRKRRESFELMRKEQQKVLQERQKSNPEKHKVDHFSKLTELLEDPKEGKRVCNKINELDDRMIQPDQYNDSSKAPGWRPLVPPGFATAIAERNSSTRCLTNSHSTEVGSHAKGIQNGTLDNQQEIHPIQNMCVRQDQHESTSIYGSSVKKGDEIVDSSEDLKVSIKKLGVDNQLSSTSSLSEVSGTLDGCEIVEFDAKKVAGHKITADPQQDHSTSMLEKIFCSALTLNSSGSSGFVEHHDPERDNTQSPKSVRSSKFSQWFVEDGKKAAEDTMYARPSDLLSLIVGGEKGGSQASYVKATKQSLPGLPLHNCEPTNSHLASSTIGISEQFYSSSKHEAVPAILTCEDLEQTILSEYSESKSSSTLQVPDQGCSVSGAKTEESKPDINNHASQHLLSLLQTGKGLTDIVQSPISDSTYLDKLHVPEGAIVGSALDSSKEGNAPNILHSGKSLTLETLFGSAFMKELQSVEAPVSIQRGPVGSSRPDISEPHGRSFGVMDDNLFSTSSVGIGSHRNSHESNVLLSSQRQQAKSDHVENRVGINDTHFIVDPPKHLNTVMHKGGGFDGAVDIQLPEEESLITVGDPVHNPNSVFISAGNSTNGLLSSDKSVNIAEKLATLNTIFRDERSMVGQGGPHFVRGPYDPTEPEIPFHNVHGQPPSSQFHPPQMNHGRPFLRPLDSNPTRVRSQMNFMAPEGIIHPDDPSSHQFPTNMLRPPFRHPNTGPAGFDLPPAHAILQPGKFSPPHVLREFPRGGPLPPHSTNQVIGFMEQPNPMQGFPFGQQQSNLGRLGMPLQAPEVRGGSNHPDALQRLLQMELRAKSKQIHAFADVGNSPGIFGPEVDMGFRYR